MSPVFRSAHDHRARRDALAQVDLFSGCGRRELERVADLAYPRSFRSGTVVCREGEPGDEFYVIVSGQTAVTLDDQRLITLGPGSFFGERALLGSRTRTATVTANNSLGVLVL